MTGDAVFEAERGRLFGLAYRLLGSASDAEDMLQRRSATGTARSRRSSTAPRRPAASSAIEPPES